MATEFVCLFVCLFVVRVLTDVMRWLGTAARFFLARLIFDHEVGGDTFLRNVGSHKATRCIIPEDGHIYIWVIPILYSTLTHCVNCGTEDVSGARIHM
jgi:hypothetical protein